MADIDLSNIPKSITMEKVGERPLRFSSRTDYCNALLAQSVAPTEHDLISDPEVVVKIQQHWQNRTQQIGCRFAQFMSHEPSEFGWHRIVVYGSRPKEWPLSSLERQIEESIHDPTRRALSLIFPEVTNEKQLAQLTLSIGGFQSSSIEEIDVVDDGRLIQLGLRVRLSEMVRAFALAFGPFAKTFPLTRQAPFMEFTFPTKPKEKPLREGLERDDNAAHLADVPLPVGGDAWRKMIRGTKKLKRQVLDGSHPSARARVSLAISRRVWEETRKR